MFTGFQVEMAYPFLAVLSFILLDMVTGFINSLITKSFQSSKMRKGIANKIGEIMAMVLIYALAYVAPMLGIMNGEAVHVLPMVLGVYIVIMEIGSVVENISELSPNTGNKLKEIMEEIDNDN